jgi:hypothetical protein
LESQQQEALQAPLQQVLVWRVLLAVALLLPSLLLDLLLVLEVLLPRLHFQVSQAALLDSLVVVVVCLPSFLPDFCPSLTFW